MAKITSTVAVNGSIFQRTHDITDDLPADIIGENVTEVVNEAWRAGNDPTQFIVVVQFT